MSHAWLKQAGSSTNDTEPQKDNQSSVDNLRATLQAQNSDQHLLPSSTSTIPDSNTPDTFSQFLAQLHAQPLEQLKYVAEAHVFDRLRMSVELIMWCFVRSIRSKRQTTPTFFQRGERCSDTSEFLELCSEMDTEHDKVLNLSIDVTAKLSHAVSEVTSHWNQVCSSVIESVPVRILLVVLLSFLVLIMLLCPQGKSRARSLYSCLQVDGREVGTTRATLCFKR
jgi:hypothetical protein